MKNKRINPPDRMISVIRAGQRLPNEKKKSLSFGATIKFFRSQLPFDQFRVKILCFTMDRLLPAARRILATFCQLPSKTRCRVFGLCAVLEWLPPGAGIATAFRLKSWEKKNLALNQKKI